MSRRGAVVTKRPAAAAGVGAAGPPPHRSAGRRRWGTASGEAPITQHLQAPASRALLLLLLCAVAAQVLALTGPSAPGPAPDDTYAGQPVCGADGATYPAAAAAADAGVAVLHCGPCGACSNAQDLGVYASTAANLTAAVRGCGLRILPSAVSACLAGIGFIPGCAACFQANIDCDAAQCLAPCLQFTAAAVGRGLLHRVRRLAGLSDAASLPPQESLADNPCLACDEERCGPAFLACAGANRRRAGIVSNIQRDDRELCQEASPHGGSSGGGGGECALELAPAPEPFFGPAP